MTNILVCGGRDYYKYTTVWQTLGNLVTDLWFVNPEDVITILHGDLIGAEFLAKVFAADEYDTNPLINNMEYFNTSGVTERNTRMLADGQPDLVVCFGKGPEANNMIKIATAAGVEVIRVK